jgi:histidine triad (HIT) family protein
MNISNKNYCLLCKIVRHELPSIVLDENKDILAIMDFYPATPGHILVLPKHHMETIYAMPNEIGVQIMAMAISITKAIAKQLQPKGLNLIQANGQSAG